MKSIFKKLLRTADRGQAILLIAFAMVGLVAFVGLMTDGGLLLIEYGKLKRGIDAAAIASSQQFRRGFSGADLATAARNFLILNESDSSQITIYRCKDDLLVVDGTEHDGDLCTTPARKLVRVEAVRTVYFGFLRVVGFTSYDLTASSVGEAASIDLVLVIDTSTSMSYQTDGDANSAQPLDDPTVCNYSVSLPCQPLADVKDVALDFLDTMYFPYDRVAVVAFTSQPPDNSRTHTTILSLSDTQADVVTAISNLKVFEPPVCDFTVSPGTPDYGPCRKLDAVGIFTSYDCPRFRDTGDLSSCNSSNIGGAMTRAWTEFSNPLITVRADALWITILLAGGPANATDCTGTPADCTLPLAGVAPPADEFPFGHCPVLSPPCRDGDASSRHSSGDTDYDADDYARDAADDVADPLSGGGITIYTIGLGNLIQNAPAGDPDGAEQLLEYIADTAGDPPGCIGNTCASHGFYSYAPNTSQLDDIFASIAENIFTKIAK